MRRRRVGAVRRTRFLFVAVAAIVLATSAPASACSCAYQDARDRLKKADAAIIGTALSRVPSSDPSVVTYTFSVDEEVKGTFEDTVEIETASNGAACGLEVAIGQQTGLFLTGSDAAGWSSSLCQQIAPDELRDAAAPMPEPNGEGPIRLIAGGNWGDMGLFALDSEGRTLMYGKRASGSSVIDVCPNSRFFIEVPWGGENRWVVRRVSNFEVVDVVSLPRNAGPQDCLAEDASEVLVYRVRYDEPTSRSKLYRYHDGDLDLLYEGTSIWFTVIGDHVYLTEGRYGRNVRVLDLATGKKTFIARVPRYAQSIAVSPDESLLATTGSAGQSELLTVIDRSRDNRLATKDHGEGMAGELYWLDNETLAYLPGGYDNTEAKVFDPSLNVVRVLDGPWYTLAEDFLGDVAYGAGWGGLYRAPLPDGPSELLREFPSPEIHSVSVVPGEIFPASP